jgi:hypothetical protein
VLGQFIATGLFPVVCSRSCRSYDGSIAGKLRIDLPFVDWVRPGIQTVVLLSLSKRRTKKEEKKKVVEAA